MTSRDWLADRNELERRWKNWRRTITHRGQKLSVEIPLEANWVDIEKRFPLSFGDRFGGVCEVRIPKPLIRLTERHVMQWVRKSLPRVPVGRCVRCDRKALLQDLEGTRNLCRRCVLRSIAEGARADAKRRNAQWKIRAMSYAAKGFRYVLEVWIHPKRGGDDYFLEIPFKSKPTGAAARRIARKNGSALLDDFRIRPL